MGCDPEDGGLTRASVATYLVIFGAAVRPDGRPSGILRRRIEGALSAAASLDDVVFLPTGGRGREGHVEAEVMAAALRQAGASADRIIIEPIAGDTLESVRRCHGLLQARGDAEAVLVCTSPFHQLRCALLLSILAYRVRRPTMPRDLPSVGLPRWLAYVAKEFVSTPYDCALMLFAVMRRRPGL